METELPASMKQALAKKHVKFYNIDAIAIAGKVGLGNRVSTPILQSRVLLSRAASSPIEEADGLHEGRRRRSPSAARATTIVQMNCGRRSTEAVAGLVKIDVPAELGERHDRRRGRSRSPRPAYFDEIVAAHPGAGGRQAARFRVQVQSRRLRAHRHHAVREARHRGEGSHVGRHRKLHPVQPVRDGLPARRRSVPYLANDESSGRCARGASRPSPPPAKSSPATSSACRSPRSTAPAAATAPTSARPRIKALEMVPLADVAEDRGGRTSRSPRLCPSPTSPSTPTNVKDSQFLKPLLRVLRRLRRLRRDAVRQARSPSCSATA